MKTITFYTDRGNGRLKVGVYIIPIDDQMHEGYGTMRLQTGEAGKILAELVNNESGFFFAFDKEAALPELCHTATERLQKLGGLFTGMTVEFEVEDDHTKMKKKAA